MAVVLQIYKIYETNITLRLYYPIVISGRKGEGYEVNEHRNSSNKLKSSNELVQQYQSKEEAAILINGQFAQFD